MLDPYKERIDSFVILLDLFVSVTDFWLKKSVSSFVTLLFETAVSLMVVWEEERALSIGTDVGALRNASKILSSALKLVSPVSTNTKESLIKC